MGKSFLLSICKFEKGYFLEQTTMGNFQMVKNMHNNKIATNCNNPKIATNCNTQHNLIYHKTCLRNCNKLQKKALLALFSFSVKANTSLNLIRIIKSQQIAERTFKKLFQTVDYFSFFIIYSANIPFITHLSLFGKLPL